MFINNNRNNSTCVKLQISTKVIFCVSSYQVSEHKFLLSSSVFLWLMEVWYKFSREIWGLENVLTVVLFFTVCALCFYNVSVYCSFYIQTHRHVILVIWWKFVHFIFYSVIAVIFLLSSFWSISYEELLCSFSQFVANIYNYWLIRERMWGEAILPLEEQSKHPPLHPHE